MSETTREYAVNQPPLHIRFKRGQSGDPRGPARENLQIGSAGDV